MSATVAIITRTKDRPLLLERAIRSVLEQTFGEYEHVIVNDVGDRRAVDELVARHADAYRGRVRVVHREASAGMESATNAGLAASSSRFIALLDDDDTWEPTFLEATVRYLTSEKPNSVRGVVTRATTVHERLEGERVVEVRREPTNHTLKQVTLFRMAAGNVFAPLVFVYERAVLDDVGTYREDLPVLGDWEFNVRFLSRYDIAVLPIVLANYHVRTSDGATPYANSVVGSVDRHRLVESTLRNEWLRADLASGRVGLGVASGLGGMLVDVERRVLWMIERKAADPMSVAGRALTWGRTRAERVWARLGESGTGKR